MEKCKKTFSHNDYPIALTDTYIESFMHKIYYTKDKVHTVPVPRMLYDFVPLTLPGHHVFFTYYTSVVFIEL